MEVRSTREDTSRREGEKETRSRIEGRELGQREIKMSEEGWR